MNTFEWNLVKANGESPGLLDEHSAVVSGWNMLLFGGYGKTGWKNDVYIFNVDEKHWTRKHGGDDLRRFP